MAELALDRHVFVPLPHVPAGGGVALGRFSDPCGRLHGLEMAIRVGQGLGRVSSEYMLNVSNVNG